MCFLFYDLSVGVFWGWMDIVISGSWCGVSAQRRLASASKAEGELVRRLWCRRHIGRLGTAEKTLDIYWTFETFGWHHQGQIGNSEAGFIFPIHWIFEIQTVEAKWTREYTFQSGGMTCTVTQRRGRVQPCVGEKQECVRNRLDLRLISVNPCLTSDLCPPYSPPSVRDDPGGDSHGHRDPVPAVLALHPVSYSVCVCVLVDDLCSVIWWNKIKKTYFIVASYIFCFSLLFHYKFYIFILELQS